MNIDNVNVFNLAGAIVGSGLPMLADYDMAVFRSTVLGVETHVEEMQPHIDRAIRLARLGSPHCNFLTGILVVFNVTATQAFFLQAHRYHWWQVVSSQSKMHRLKQMVERETAGFADKTRTVAKNVLSGLNADDVEEMVYNCPMGLETTEQVATNYMQLRTCYAQRHDHRLQEWRNFCAWIETLPMARELICVENKNKEDKQK